MARTVVDDWIPEESASEVISRVTAMSAVEARARRVGMSSATKTTPRSGAAVVANLAKGASYGEDASTNDEVLLTARKFGGAFRLADEDLNDNIVDTLNAKRMEWARAYAITLDNAALGVTAAENGTTVPFTSVRNAHGVDVNAATATAVTYANLSATFGIYEESDYYDPSGSLVIAHPSFKADIRDIVDSQGQPVFQANVRENLGGGQVVDTLFGVPIMWSLGCRESATHTGSPSGDPLLIVCNPDYLILGVRSGPESAVAGADSGAAFLTDEALLKVRARRGFALGQTAACAILSNTP